MNRLSRLLVAIVWMCLIAPPPSMQVPGLVAQSVRIAWNASLKSFSLVMR